MYDPHHVLAMVKRRVFPGVSFILLTNVNKAWSEKLSLVSPKCPIAELLSIYADDAKMVKFVMDKHYLAHSRPDYKTGFCYSFTKFPINQITLRLLKLQIYTQMNIISFLEDFFIKTNFTHIEGDNPYFAFR